jgi:hypothetical protein
MELREGFCVFWTNRTHKTRKETGMNLEHVGRKIWESLKNFAWDFVGIGHKNTHKTRKRKMGTRMNLENVGRKIDIRMWFSVRISAENHTLNSVDIFVYFPVRDSVYDGIQLPIREEKKQG